MKEATMTRRYVLSSVLLMLALTIVGQTITVQAPSRVMAGENFRVAYTINTQDVDEFHSGIRSTDEADVIAGPFTSSQSSFQMVNGHTSSSSSITYTYTLYAAKNGTFVIPAAHAMVGGKKIVSAPRKVAISGTAKGGNGAPSMHNDADDQPQMRQAGSAITANDLFIKVSANKQRVHEQEPILLTYKVYTLVDLTQLEGKMPDLTGFHTQEVKLPQQKSFHTEQVNGRNYRCVTWSQYVMYPQMTGKLEIPSITFKGIVVQQNRSVDPFEAFFNGGSGYVEVKREIKAPGLTVQVDPLPQRPASFSGGVGRFNISAQIDRQEVKAGDPVSLRVVIGGVGNLKLIKEPTVTLPKDFEKYDPKVTDKTQLTANGVEGNMVYDILFVPRHQGDYTIPPVQLTYYDTSVNAYKTIQTGSFALKVQKGDGTGGKAVDYSAKDQDIHALKTGRSSQRSVGEYFYGSAAYWVVLLSICAVFALLLYAFRKRALDRADVVGLRGRKANKTATKRLRKARQLMQRGRSSEFYDEVLRALWGYVGDKMNIPVASLSRDNVSEQLAQRGVDEAVVGSFLSALDECEFERYAPGDAQGNMGKTFESAMAAITHIEESMKKSRKKPSRQSAPLLSLLLLVAGLAFSPAAQAITKANADAEYQKGNYQQAIADYKELLQQGVSAELYYNLGNAYFRTDQITQAVLAYERAHRLSPGDADIRFNLQFARSKTIDKITPQGEMFFVTWFHSLVELASVDGWAYVGLGALAASLLLFLLWLFPERLWLRQAGFYGAAVLLVVFLLSNLFAYRQRQQLADRRGAIVVAPSVSVKKTPAASGTDEFVIHEGTRVDITDKGMKDWRAVVLADGREGWVRTQQIEEI